MDLKKVAKYFIDWTKKKIRCHINEAKNELYFRKREIWWVAI